MPRHLGNSGHPHAKRWNVLKPVHLLGSGPGVDHDTLRSLLGRALREAAKPEPTVAYIGAASGDDGPFFRMCSRMLRESGAGEVLLAPTAGRRADPHPALAVLSAADLIFVSGGDVEEGMRVLDGLHLVEHLRRFRASGIPFVGVSAGSIMLARSWLRWADPDDDDTAEAFDCLGFAPLLCDAHGEDEGWLELKALLRLAGPGAVGYGLPTNGALCVWPDGRVAAFGDPVVRFRKQGGAVRPLADVEPRQAAPARRDRRGSRTDCTAPPDPQPSRSGRHR